MNRKFPIHCAASLALLLCPAAYADTTHFSCQGDIVSTDLVNDSSTGPAPQTYRMHLRRSDDKAFLALAGQAFIEASDDGTSVAFTQVANVLGHESLRLDYGSGEAHYEQVVTRTGTPVSRLQFHGHCTPAQESGR